jgi:hypothetical protein
MDNLETSNNSKTSLPLEVTDPFVDPVGFLAAHGIEAELVEHVCPIPEAA